MKEAILVPFIFVETKKYMIQGKVMQFLVCIYLNKHSLQTTRKLRFPVNWSLSKWFWNHSSSSSSSSSGSGSSKLELLMLMTNVLILKIMLPRTPTRGIGPMLIKFWIKHKAQSESPD